nr:putative 2-aminoethylphosphonate ABC transporter ATP-binding protein [Agrobacterium tumefaciens]
MRVPDIAAKASVIVLQTPYLQLFEISKKYETFVALDGVSLEFNKSEFVCFLGPSGCGKTTLLRIIAGLETASSGRILQEKRDITRAPPRERDFGIVFQSYALFPNLTVAANVGYGLYNSKMSRADKKARVHQMLDLTGIESQSNKYPAQLSGGQQQRVALARALAISPGLLLLDEPLSALDARVRYRLRSELRELQQRLGVTTIMVTHDQEEALAVADRIVVMSHGRVEQFGTAAEIYNNPASEFVADFVGEMNFLDGESLSGDTVSINGTAFQTSRAERPLETGSAVRIGIRPNEVRIFCAENEPNSLMGVVHRQEFLGPFVRLHMACVEFPHVQIRADVTESDIREHTVEVGSRLKLSLPAEKMRIFAGEKTK